MKSHEHWLKASRPSLAICQCPFPRKEEIFFPLTDAERLIVSSRDGFGYKANATIFIEVEGWVVLRHVCIGVGCRVWAWQEL